MQLRSFGERRARFIGIGIYVTGSSRRWRRLLFVLVVQQRWNRSAGNIVCGTCSSAGCAPHCGSGVDRLLRPFRAFGGSETTHRIDGFAQRLEQALRLDGPPLSKAQLVGALILVTRYPPTFGTRGRFLRRLLDLGGLAAKLGQSSMCRNLTDMDGDQTVPCIVWFPQLGLDVICEV